MTLTIDEVLKTVRVKAARTWRRDSEVIDDALRRDLGLDLLEQLWAGSDLDETAAVELALEAQRAARQQ